MLDTETKRKIDNCRDMLVGKLPSPQSQVEQITIALIYKFMDDMDCQSVEMGGKRSFFTGEYSKYAWSNIFDPKIGGFELLSLYGEALVTMNQNPNIPQLFRDIFKNAFLPYRDPETLRNFLKEINKFSYDHSERLGDAFEYLLSVLSSQGDAGQFRTPRHIIDFIVEIVDPQKNETVLDPACGTGGFLISAHKHIVKSNTGKKSGDLLTPAERKRILTNFYGYDISPDMVRLSLVNMYLHGFRDPKIFEYDTLTSEERWNETADVVLANPPFMTPKGGIKPHNRFSIQANRSEVLFVDYIAEHLNPQGRAGIIVPEGIIFQSQNSYKALRKMLIENYLWSVVSLPAGIFNPYSGVKTSVLLMDKSIAKKSDSILFVKIENDGFGLGAQRRKIQGSDLPDIIEFIKKYKVQSLKQQASAALDTDFAHIVKKEEIAKSGDYNLTGERYRTFEHHQQSSWPMVELADLLKIQSGYAFDAKKFTKEDAGFPIIRIRNIKLGFTEDKYNGDYDSDYVVNHGDLLIGMDGEFNTTLWAGENVLLNQRVCKLHSFNKCLKEYVFYVIQRKLKEIENSTYAVTVKHISAKQIYSIKIPLPPLDVQERIVAEIEGYQKIIDGARQITENYKPTIKINPDWPMVELANFPLQIIDGDRGNNYPNKEEFQSSGYCLFLNTKNVRHDGFDFSEVMFISKEKDEAMRKGKLERNDVILTTRGTVGNVAVFDHNVSYDHIRINSGMLIFRPDMTKVLPAYIFNLFQSTLFNNQVEKMISGSAQPQLPIRVLNNIVVPLPPLEEQQQLVSQIESEQKMVNETKKLIEIFENKIKTSISEVWGNANG